MINRLLNIFLPPLKDPIQRRIANNILTVAALLLFGVSVMTFWALFIGNAQDRSIYLPLLGLMVGLTGFSLWLLRNRYLFFAGFPILAIFFIVPLAMAILDSEIIVHEAVFLLIIGMFLSTILTEERGSIVYNTFNIVGFMIVFLVTNERTELLFNSLTRFLLLGSIVFMVFGIAILITRSIRLAVQDSAKESDLRRLKLIETSNTVIRGVFARQNLENLLNDTVLTIRDQFEPIYHAQVFLLDKYKQNAVLRASTGEVGQLLLSRNFSLPVGSQSVIGQVTRQGKPVLVRTDDPIHRFNELLPDTKTELALPLQVGNEIIGALDIQSQTENAFQEDDFSIFQSLADQVALAIDNAQILEKLRSRIDENLQLYRLELQNREEIERLNQELVGKAWAYYQQKIKIEPHRTLNLQTGAVTSGGILSPTVKTAIEQKHTQLKKKETVSHVAIPITVRGVVIAVLDFDIPAHSPVSKHLLETLDRAKDQIGFVAENARLFDSSQSVLWREKTVNAAAAELQRSYNVEQLLKQAAEVFNQVLGARHTLIQLTQNNTLPIPTPETTRLDTEI